MTLHQLALIFHSYLRWIVLALLVAVAARAALGWRAGRDWRRGDERLQVTLLRAVDLQFTLGVAMAVFLSPFTRAFYTDVARGMKEPALRFFGVEHALGMLLAVAALHVGRERSRKAAAPRLRQRRVCLSALLGLLLMAGSIPWPFLRYGRPLLRVPGTAAAPALCPSSYEARCAACHGPRGRGDGFAASSLRPPPRDFAAAGWTARSDAELAAVIRDGGAAHGLSAAMPSHRGLSDAEIDGLVACVRLLRGGP